MAGLFINGQWLQGEAELLRSLSPADQAVLWEKNTATEMQVAQAVASARAAQPLWAGMSQLQRNDIVERFAALLEEQRELMATAIARETGKPLWEADTEVTAMKNKIAISIRAQQQRAGDWQRDTLALSHRPHGVMAVYGPYNFPGHLPNGHIVPALLAGNTLVFKPSEQTPLVAEITVQLWQQAGLPVGVINLLQGAADVGIALAQQAIDGVLFTGSSRTGIALHRQFAGRPEVLLALEMGGNNPLIVGDVADLSATAWTIVQSAFITAGQRCTCARRLILPRGERGDAVIRELLNVISRLRIDHWNAQPAAFMGSLISADVTKALLDAQQHLIDLGGKPLRVMQACPSLGAAYLSPGLIDMSDAKNVPDEEWFGPLLQIYRYADFSEAMYLANNTRYGLAAGLLSDDVAQQQEFIAQIHAGVISINQPTAGASSELPFGGVGGSGNHRPSAFYAADYCAWPQAKMQGTALSMSTLKLPNGVIN